MPITTAVGKKSAHSCAQRACSQMEKFPKSDFNDSSAHELSHQREKKIKSLRVEGE